MNESPGTQRKGEETAGEPTWERKPHSPAVQCYLSMSQTQSEGAHSTHTCTHAHVYIESPCYVRALRKEYIRTHKKRNVYKKQAQPDMAPFCLLFHRRPKFSSLTGSGCLRLFLDANFLTAAAAAAVINKVHKGICVERAMWKSEEENISMTAASAFEETDKFIECISAKNSIRIYLVGYIESLLSPLPTC